MGSIASLVSAGLLPQSSGVMTQALPQGSLGHLAALLDLPHGSTSTAALMPSFTPQWNYVFGTAMCGIRFHCVLSSVTIWRERDVLKVATRMMIRQLSFNQRMWYSALATFWLRCRQATLEWQIDLRLLISSSTAAYPAFNAWPLFNNAVCLLFRLFFGALSTPSLVLAVLCMFLT